MTNDNIIFFGDPYDRELSPDVVDVIKRLADAEPDSSFKIHTNPRRPLETLEWAIQITSTKGRRHVCLTQRKPFGAVFMKDESS
jgi:hypothetical protein